MGIIIRYVVEAELLIWNTIVNDTVRQFSGPSDLFFPFKAEFSARTIFGQPAHCRHMAMRTAQSGRWCQRRGKTWTFLQYCISCTSQPSFFHHSHKVSLLHILPPSTLFPYSILLSLFVFLFSISPSSSLSSTPGRIPLTVQLLVTKVSNSPPIVPIHNRSWYFLFPSLHCLALQGESHSL